MNVVVTQTAINASVSDQNISTSLTESPISVVASYLGISASLTQTQINASISQGQGISVGLAQSLVSVAVSSGLADAPINGLTYGRNNGAWVNITGTGGGGSSLPVADTQTIIMGSSDPTKLLRFEVDGFTAGATRVLTPPNANITIAGQNFANTFSVNQQMDAHLAVGANSDVTNPAELLYPELSSFDVLSVEEEFNGDPNPYDYIGSQASYILANPSSDSDAYFYGIDAEVWSKSSNTKDIGGLIGLYGYAKHQSSGDAASLIGLFYGSYNENTGTVALQMGVYLDVENFGGGRSTDMYGHQIYMFTDNSENQYGIYIWDVAGADTINAAIWTNAGLVRFGDNTIIDAHAAVGADAQIDYNPFGANSMSNSLSSVEIFTAAHSTGFYHGKQGILSYVEGNPSANASKTIYQGLFFVAQTTAGNAQPVGGIVGVGGYAIHNGDGNVSPYLRGLEVSVSNYGGGNVANQYGSYIYTDHYGTGTVTNWYGSYLDMWVGGTATTIMGHRIGISADGGSATTAYGLKIEDVDVGITSYAIHTSAGDVRLMSSALDKLGFHGSTPVAKQTVTGSRGGNDALADLLTKLANLGLITNSTTA